MIVLDDNIMQKGKPATAGSKILQNFISPFDAAVVERLQTHQYQVTERTTPDEFGIFPFDDSEKILDAAKAVADGSAGYALCNDVFGRYRQQAAENDCCYIHPTYGTVSRFGLIPTACSMDRTGVLCKNMTDGFKLLSQIAGKDSRDGAMFPEENYNYAPQDKKLTIGLPANCEILNSLTKKFETVAIELEYFNVYKQVMHILSFAEISNNINRYDGIKFGYRAEDYKGIGDLYVKTRAEGFGLNGKLVSIMGAMVLDNYEVYYEKAMKIRRLVKKSLKFDTYDIIALPCEFEASALTALAGLPSVSFNYNEQGIQLIANVKDEHLLLSAWERCMA